MQIVLTIAGFDPSGGAGVLADIKTFAALGCFGAAAITSITSQNTLGVHRTFHQSPEVFQSQLLPILSDYEIAAVKIGMLPTIKLIETVVEIAEQSKLKNIVLDPVIQSSSRHPLIDEKAKQSLRKNLMPLVDVVTPNLPEISEFLGKQPTSIEEMKTAAQEFSAQISQQKSVAVLVKGGHLPDEATDVLFDGEQLHSFTTQKLISRNTHGTGCTLSSAISALIAQDYPLPKAVMRAKEFVTQAIIHAPGKGHGVGPMNHFHSYVAK